LPFVIWAGRTAASEVNPAASWAARQGQIVGHRDHGAFQRHDQPGMRDSLADAQGFAHVVAVDIRPPPVTGQHGPFG
jgi:hypothetical protein